MTLQNRAFQKNIQSKKSRNKQILWYYWLFLKMWIKHKYSILFSFMKHSNNLLPNLGCLEKKLKKALLYKNKSADKALWT